jgi:hypothetical protein
MKTISKDELKISSKTRPLTDEEKAFKDKAWELCLDKFDEAKRLDVQGFIAGNRQMQRQAREMNDEAWKTYQAALESRQIFGTLAGYRIFI